MMFTLADWITLVLYLAGIAFLGSVFLKSQKTTREYFLGERSLPWWAVSFSIIATETSALTFIGIPAVAYQGNLAFIQIVIGYAVARVIIALTFLPTYYEQEIYSPYEVLRRRLGPTAKDTAGVIFFITNILGAGVRVFATAIPVAVILPQLGLVRSIAIIGVVTTIYTMLGGIRAVVWTEVAQFALFFLGGLFAFLYIPLLIPGGYGEAFRVATEGGKLEWFNLGLQVKEGFLMVQLKAPYTFLMGILGGTCVTMASHGTNQVMVQRLLACRNLRDSQKAIVTSGLIILPQFLMFLFVGAWLFAYYQQPGTEADLAILESNDQIFPIFIVAHMPVIIRGLMISGLFAAAMSSLSSTMAALSSVAVSDFYKQYILKAASEKHYMWVSRAMMVFWGIVLMMVAYLSRETKSVLDLGMSVASLTLGSLLGAMLLAIFFKKGNGVGVAMAMIVSFLTIWFLWIKGWVFWPWYVLLGTIITLTVGLLLSGLLGATRGERASSREEVSSG